MRHENERVFIKPNGEKYVIISRDYHTALITFVKKFDAMPYEAVYADENGNTVTEGYHPDYGPYRKVKPDKEAPNPKPSLVGLEPIRHNPTKRRYEKVYREKHDNFIVSMPFETKLENVKRDAEFAKQAEMKITAGGFFLGFGIMEVVIGLLT